MYAAFSTSLPTPPPPPPGFQAKSPTQMQEMRTNTRMQPYPCGHLHSTKELATSAAKNLFEVGRHGLGPSILRRHKGPFWLGPVVTARRDTPPARPPRQTHNKNTSIQVHRTAQYVRHLSARIPPKDVTGKPENRSNLLVKHIRQGRHCAKQGGLPGLLLIPMCSDLFLATLPLRSNGNITLKRGAPSEACDPCLTLKFGRRLD